MLEKLALQKKLITQEQCKAAVNACRGEKNLDLALKNYFLSQNIIPVRKMKSLISAIYAVKTMKKNQIFGALAVKLGIVTPEVFQREIQAQKQAMAGKKQPQFIGELWKQQEIISSKQFLSILQSQKNRPQNTKQKLPVSEAGTPAPDPVETETKLALPGGLEMTIDSRGMTALLRKTRAFDSNIGVEDILGCLIEEDIFFGVVSEEAIQGFLDSKGFREKGFLVARGKEGRHGEDARIEYYFDTDHLKAGGMDEEGNIDFKERGEIPWVEAGTLLAEKRPMIEPREGRNIFDQAIEAPPVIDLPLRYKSGVTPSEDDLRLFAEISGHPRLSWSGNIQVTDTFFVKKDVGYKTGHLAYSGDIEVKGSLRPGFRVKGHDIRINTVDGGEIHAQGDVIILNGINDALIYARGNVRAKFIQNSKLFCLGNVTADKEIVDTTIENSGAVLIPNGEIISSTIVANMGIHARHLGTDKSVPNTISMGIDAFTSKELKTIEDQIYKMENRIKEIGDKKETLHQNTSELHHATSRLAHQLDRVREEVRSISEQGPDTRESAGKNTGEAAQLRKSKALFARLDKELNQYFDRIEKNEALVLELDGEQEELTDQMEDLHYELANFLDWQEANPGLPVSVVTGRVSTGTLVKGRKSSREITDILTNVKIKEVTLTGKGKDKYEIQVHDQIKR